MILLFDVKAEIKEPLTTESIMSDLTETVDISKLEGKSSTVLVTVLVI